MESKQPKFIRFLFSEHLNGYNVGVYEEDGNFFAQVNYLQGGVDSHKKYFSSLENLENWFESIAGVRAYKMIEVINQIEEATPATPQAVKVHGTPETKGKRGLIVNVYKSFNRDGSVSDCTNGGLSGEYNEIFVLHPEGPFEENGKLPVFDYTPKGVRGAKLIPVYPGSNSKFFMFGGNIAFSSDSRFSELSMGDAVKIFDRLEF